MNELIGTLVEYLHETLGIDVKPEKWGGCRSLPVFMESLYDCYTVQILGRHCLLLVSKGDEDSTPSAVRKHHDITRQNWPEDVIVVKRAIASNSRKRLVQFKVPFVVPGNQLYLPDMGLDLREHFRRVRGQEKPFSPSTQVVVLRALLTGSYGPLTSTQLIGTLPYTPMTITRIFDEIEQCRIGVAHMRGRERELQFEKTGRDLWDAALPFLRSPVLRQVAAMFPPGAVAGMEAGLTALSRYSMISAPTSPILAVSPEVWKAAKANPDVGEITYEDEDAYHLEIWRYDPALLSAEDAVDRLSLFLSLRDTNDERVEAALDEMIGSVKW